MNYAVNQTGLTLQRNAQIEESRINLLQIEPRESGSPYQRTGKSCDVCESSQILFQTELRKPKKTCICVPLSDFL